MKLNEFFITVNEIIEWDRLLMLLEQIGVPWIKVDDIVHHAYNKKYEKVFIGGGDWEINDSNFQVYPKLKLMIVQNVELYNTLVIDVQGFELNVLKGGQNILNNIDYIMTEINVQEMYENCCLVSDLDLYLSDFGFERVETDLCGQNWGDALYVKNKKVKP